MRRLLTVICLGATLCTSAVRAEEALAKRSFEEGVAAAEAKHWEEARQHFEASLVEADKPATRFNLVLVNEQLKHPLEVARHALAFLALPERPEHAEARARASELLARAITHLATLTTDALPSELEPHVDGGRPITNDQGKIYLEPGWHTLQTLRNGAPLSAIDIELVAGQVAAWPRPNEEAPPAQQPPAPATRGPMDVPEEPALEPRISSLPRESARTPVAWAFGGMGATLQLAALGVYLGAVHRAREFSERDVFLPGVDEARDDALRLQDAVLPLALTGGTLMAAAIVTGSRSTRVGTVAWSVGALAAGSALAAGGLVLAVPEPATVSGSELPAPTRQAGYLLISSALPLLAYGIGSLITRRHDRWNHTRACSSLGMRW